MNWFPLNNYTHYSLLKGFSKPKELAKICKDNEYPACGITDYKTISGCVSFYKACKDAGIKPILGCSFDGYNLYAKNKDGWYNLIEIISSIDDNNNVDESLVKNILAKNNLIFLSHDVGIPTSFYCYKEQASLHRILLCSELKTTLPNLNKQIKKNEISISENNYIIKGKSSKLLDDIYYQCEDYDILNKPILPKFKCPNNLSEEEYLKELCRKGWKSLLIDKGKVSDEVNKQKYLDRFKEEFDVIKNANLFGYFLIVQDIIKYVNDSGWMSGPGRGCFLPDTRVKMSSGLMKNISDIKIGDKVVDCEGKEQRVYDTLIYDVEEEILELWFGKIVIRCTKDHKFLTTNRGWVEAQYLTEKDDILEV